MMETGAEKDGRQGNYISLDGDYKGLYTCIFMYWKPSNAWDAEFLMISITYHHINLFQPWLFWAV